MEQLATQRFMSLYARNLGQRVGGEVDLMVDETEVWIGIEQTEEACVGAGTERHYLLRSRWVCTEELGHEQVNGGGANVGACP